MEAIELWREDVCHLPWEGWGTTHSVSSSVYLVALTGLRLKQEETGLSSSEWHPQAQES